MSEKCQCRNQDCPAFMFPEPDSEAMPPVAGSAASFPAQCPACGKPKAEGWVKGWRGWECGSYSRSHDHDRENGLNFRQSIPCATDHWKQRALRAEYLLTLIPILPPNA